MQEDLMEISENDVPEENSSNPLDAIRKFCVECSGGHTVKSCPSDGTTDPMCKLFPFRLGKNPFRKKVELSETEKSLRAERLANARRKS
jgi:hypothetical protein